MLIGEFRVPAPVVAASTIRTVPGGALTAPGRASVCGGTKVVWAEANLSRTTFPY